MFFIILIGCQRHHENEYFITELLSNKNIDSIFDRNRNIIDESFRDYFFLSKIDSILNSKLKNNNFRIKKNNEVLFDNFYTEYKDKKGYVYYDIILVDPIVEELIIFKFKKKNHFSILSEIIFREPNPSSLKND